MLRPTALFAHPELAGIRALLERSPTARGVMDAVDELPTGVQLMHGTDEHATDWAWYSGVRNRISIPEGFLLAHAGEATPTDVENAALVLHEARHRQQHGRLPMLHALGETVAAARGVVAGIRERSSGGRFMDGFDASTMRDEVDAYQVQLRTMRELVPGHTDPAEEAPERVLAFLRGNDEYTGRIRGHRLNALAGAGGIGAAATWGGVELVRD